MKYRKEIDGLRAVAVLPVIFYHAGFSFFKGGFVGVDVFFVISGYLITTILLSELHAGKFSIAHFYERRARRILPVLFLVIFFCLPFAWSWLLPSHLKEFSKSLVAVSAFSSNILFWKEGGYFANAADLKPLLHTWSLAVEEQYYLFFPIVLSVLWKIRKRKLFAVIFVLSIASFLMAQWGIYRHPRASFFLLPPRGWELAIGALIAFYFYYKRDHLDFVKDNGRISEVFGLLGLVLIGYACCVFDQSTPFPGAHALVPTVGTALVVAYSSADTLVGRVLSTRILVGLGLISYSAYLWHQPIFVFAKHRSVGNLDFTTLVFLSMASIVLAYFSWKYVETPFRNKQFFSKKFILIFSVSGSIFLASVGFYGVLSHNSLARVNSAGVSFDYIENKILPNWGLNEKCDGNVNFPSFCRNDENPEILVWGDSFAMQIVDGILSSNPQAKIMQMTKSACGPFFDIAPLSSANKFNWAKECIEFNNKVRSLLKHNDSIKYVVISSPFERYVGDYYKNGRGYGKILYNGRIYDANFEFAKKQFLKTLEEIQGLGIVPVTFSPLPQTDFDIGECLKKSIQYNAPLDRCDFSQQRSVESSKIVQRFLEEISKEHKVVKLADYVCFDGTCKSHFDDTFIYRDHGHMTREGAKYLGAKHDFYKKIVDY